MKQLSNNAILCRGKYKIERVLGQGGFGITYKATMRETVSGSLGNMEVDVSVAIKEFFMKDTCEREEGTGKITVPSQGSRALVEQYRKKFVKEAKNLAQMDHPHIVKVVDVFEENDTVYYVMQYLSGGSLSDYVKQHGALDEATAIKYVQQIGSALEYMHQKHICHYDVKPSNILLDDKGNAMLIDFGISKGYTEEGHQTSSTPVGVSAGYAPLEQYQQNLQEFSPATDVYALAATLCYLVTGATPPEASIVLNEGIGDRPSNLSDTVWNAIGQGMNPRKKGRVQTIGAFLNLVNGITETNQVPLSDVKEETISVSKSIMDSIADANNNTNEQTIIASQNEQQIDNVETAENKSNSRKIGIIAFAVLLVLGGFYFTAKQSNEKSTESTTPLVEKTIDENAQKQNKEEKQDAYSTQSENQATNSSLEKVYDVVEEMPSFPGGQGALMSYLGSHIEYPLDAQENGVEGRVIVSFVVERDGSIFDAKVVRSVAPSLDHEAMRVVKSMPKWTPGKQNGENVRVKYSVPIVFRLQ